MGGMGGDLQGSTSDGMRAQAFSARRCGLRKKMEGQLQPAASKTGRPLPWVSVILFKFYVIKKMTC
jgi:hypothetical protein